jgi:hypothetical protein
MKKPVNPVFLSVSIIKYYVTIISISDFGMLISDLFFLVYDGFFIRNPKSATEPKASSAKPIRNIKLILLHKSLSIIRHTIFNISLISQIPFYRQFCKFFNFK